MTPTPSNSPPDISAETVIQLFQRKWWILVAFGLVGFAGGALYTILSPPSFEARATLLLALPDKAQSPLSLISPTGPSPLSIIGGVLRSKTAEDRIIKASGISRRELREFFVVNEDNKANSLVLKMNYSPNSKALQVIQAAVETLKQLDKEIGFSVASKTATSLAAGIKSKEADLKRAETELAMFQASMKTPMNLAPSSSAASAEASFAATALSYNKQLKDLQFQLKSVQAELNEARTRARQSAIATETLSSGVPQVQTWRDLLTKKQYELKLARQRLGPSAAEVIRLQREMEVTERQLATEISNYVESVNSGVAPEIAKLEARQMLLNWQVEYIRPLAQTAPTEAMQLKRLMAEVTTLQAVVTQLRTRFETAKLEAEVDQVKWSLLDPPALDDTPSNFRPVRTGGIFAVICLMLGFIILLRNDRKTSWKAA